MDKNKREMEQLYQWASDNYKKELEDKYFTKIDGNCKSYFKKRSSGSEYCKEYKFETMQQLKNELSVMWKDEAAMQQIEKVVLVAAMKNKPYAEKKGQYEGKENTGNMEQLKPFIYNF